MALKLLFFADCSERLGRKQLEVALERPASLIVVLRSIPELTPLLAGNGLSRLKVAVNLQYAETETVNVKARRSSSEKLFVDGAQGSEADWSQTGKVAARRVPNVHPPLIHILPSRRR